MMRHQRPMISIITRNESIATNLLCRVVKAIAPIKVVLIPLNIFYVGKPRLASR